MNKQTRKFIWGLILALTGIILLTTKDYTWLTEHIIFTASNFIKVLMIVAEIYICNLGLNLIQDSIDND